MRKEKKGKERERKGKEKKGKGKERERKGKGKKGKEKNRKREKIFRLFSSTPATAKIKSSQVKSILSSSTL